MMLSAALSWFDRQRPAPKHADKRTLPADAFTPPDAEAIEVGRWEAPHGDAPAPAAPYEGLLATLQGDYAPPPAPPAPNPARVAGGYADGGPVPAREPIVAGQFDRDLAATKRQADWPEPPDYGRPPTRTGEVLLEIDQQIAGSLAARNQTLRAQVRTVTAERDAARKRVAELELTVKALGEVIAHAVGHDKGGGGAAGAEGGE